MRGKGGLFLPDRLALGREPLTVYLSQLDEPADALAEYIRLTGHPAMPAKWVMGYMQSHRTLLGRKTRCKLRKNSATRNCRLTR